MRRQQVPEQDVIIVGAGAAGVSAAIEAASRGANTLVIEACVAIGGAAAVSGGGTCVVDSPLQRSLGLEDSVELALEDWLQRGGCEVDEIWAERYIRRSTPDVFEWARGLGVEWIGVDPQEGNRVPRWHVPRGDGAEVIRMLQTAASARGVRWRLGTRVTRLLKDESGRVTGVAVESESGDEEPLWARAVVVTTGGYTGSSEYVARYCPDVGPGSRVLVGGSRSSQGDGVALLAQLDAEFVGLERCWMYPYGTPDDRDRTGVRGMAVRGLSNEIWVNSAGHRFHDENLRGGATGTPALLAQNPATCWSIFDSVEALELTLVDPQYGAISSPDRASIGAFLTRSPYVHRGETPVELARAVGLPVDALKASLSGYNSGFGDGADPFGRDLTGLRPIDKPSFIALQFFPLARKSLGGVRTTESCEVLREDGEMIAGLYAAGEVAGMAGGHINGRAALEGTMFGPSLFSGRIAGICAARAGITAELTQSTSARTPPRATTPCVATRRLR